jgi:hypothetical protein
MPLSLARSRFVTLSLTSTMGLALVGFAAAGCQKERPKGSAAAQAPRGLPGDGQAGGSATGTMPPVHGGGGMGGMANPHGGGDPHGGMGGMANPHGGGDPHGGMGGMANPHGGGAMGGGMQGTTPTPGPLDPSTLLEGTLEVAPALAAKVKPGDVIFLSVKQVDEKGAIMRMPLAVDRLEAPAAFPQVFALSNQNMMVAGGKIAGNIAITARVDRDGDAMTRVAGDIEGVLKTAPPQKGLKLVLDTEIP